MTLEYKLLTPEFKIGDELPDGELLGYSSTFGNWDDVQERPVKGAFSPHLPAFLKDGFVAIGHDWSALPIATPTEAYEDEHGLFVRAAFHSTPDAQNARTVVRERLARGKSVKLSIGYEVLRDEYVEEGRLLKEIKLFEFSIVTVPANQLANVTSAKRMPLADQSDAVLATVKEYTARLEDLHTLRAKDGRVLSGENRKRIEAAVEALSGASKVLSDLLAATEPKHYTETHVLRAEYERQRARLRVLGVYAP